MFEVLVYVYENYWQGAACPESDRLGRKLTAAGFDADEIRDALVWLDGLSVAAQGVRRADHNSEAASLPAAEDDVKPHSESSVRVWWLHTGT